MIFSLTSTEEFKRLTNEYINIVKTGLYEKLRNVKIEFLKKGKKQFFSERQIAFYSSTPQETSILYLNEIQNAIMNNEFSKVSILNNYIASITQNYIKYYNNELSQKKMNEILNHLLPKVAKEIVEEKIYSIEIRNYALLCENKDVLNVIRNIENKLIEEVKKKYYGIL